MSAKIVTDEDCQFPTPVWPSMESLEEANPLRQYYPETVYPNGMCTQAHYCAMYSFWPPRKVLSFTVRTRQVLDPRSRYWEEGEPPRQMRGFV